MGQLFQGIPFVLVEYEKIWDWVLANSALCASLAIYHLVSNARFYIYLTGALQAATITGTAWLVLTVFLRFSGSEDAEFVLNHVLGLIFVILPILNHVGIFIAIRRHNKQLVGAVSGPNASLIFFRREKKAAIDMIIVIAVQLLCLCPSIAVHALQRFFPDNFEVLYVWSTTIICINSAINPVIYLVRNSEIRSAVKLMIC